MTLNDKITPLHSCPALFEEKGIYKCFVDGMNCSYKVKEKCQLYHTIKSRTAHNRHNLKQIEDYKHDTR